MSNQTPSSRRLLLRPPNQKQQTPPPLSNSVVVVGFIGRHVSHIINRVLDANVFGSGRSDSDLLPPSDESREELNRWFRRRRVSYFHEEERGIVYLGLGEVPESSGRFDGEGPEGSERLCDVVEEREFGDLQGMLFMFSVCHIIILIQEGSRLDTQILKKFRNLQQAKNAMASYVTSLTPSYSTPRSSPSTRSPGRTGGNMRRSGSAISFISGVNSPPSYFPGQCIPAILFIFIDDFSDFTSSSYTEDLVTSSSLNQSSSGSLAMPNTSKEPGPGPVVVLARAVNKSEGGLKRKLQSSLEAQIRFSIKKGRTLTGSETGRSSSRGGGLSNSYPLFTLDASKAVALLDTYSNKRGESLNFATNLVENVLNKRATSDSLLLESYSQNSTREDILSVREFIYKQSDTLRGRGGLVTNASSGSVGMVAVAAAAAAAASSSVSIKAIPAPDLPGVDTWLSGSRQILQAILSAYPGRLVETEIGNRNTRPKIVQRNSDPLEIATSCLDSGKGLIDKFSTLWCQRALPAAKEVYLNELPECYPTFVHETHMKKALRAFRSMVKGPSVEIFAKKLEELCTGTWTGGRQLCDFISLTGKPCIHLKHGVETDGEFLDNETVKPHSSGFFFLQACACGKSRELNSDPFDFKSANINSKSSQKCCKFLPEIQLPQLKNSGPIQGSWWSLVRIGEAKHYETTKGLLHTGFCPTQKFLLKWKIFLEKSKEDQTEEISSTKKNVDPSGLSLAQLPSGKEVDKANQTEEDHSNEKMIIFGRGVPNFTLKKPFSEVVAGSAATISKFPPLQPSKQPSRAWLKGTSQSSTSGNSVEHVTKKIGDGSIYQKTVQENGLGVDNKDTDSGPFPELSSKHVLLKVKSGEKIHLNPRHLNVFIGFEHECPCGHRYILTPDHLNKLGSLYSVPEESNIPLRGESLDNDRGKYNNDFRHGRPRHTSHVNTFPNRRTRNVNKTKEISGKGSTYLDRAMQVKSSGRGHERNFCSESDDSDPLSDIKEGLRSLDFSNDAFSMLNRNLPIYMNCAQCRSSNNKEDPPEANFAATISQLQRVFVVTPPFPVVLATCPVIQFEQTCLSPSIPDREQKLQFSFECPIILPPESFLSIKLPFMYGVQLEDGSLQSLKPFDYQPELTAWVDKGTILKALSKEPSV